MVGPVNVKTISTLNVKSGRSGKCEKKFGQLHDQSDGQFGQFGRPGQFFFVIFGFRGVNIPKVKNLGMCHDVEKKCKMLIQEWAGVHFWFFFRCKKIGGHLGGLCGQKFKNI